VTRDPLSLALAGLLMGLAAAITVTRACEHVVPDPLRGPAPTVHPSIRAWDAGARDR
jgi:hypothetical protein